MNQLRKLSWYLKFKLLARHIFLSLLIFQFIRTLLFPTTFDVVLLTIVALLYFAVILDWI
ncbi:hypothetical protein [Rubeoparvulum massiliense]|uniref:hypothetical protein n=1 Tax=Rubeoparvulum massiliense TaxID=1631346 RepID=UPI00065DEED7|nr:hypothetical protein [Rubeoparvulum massiliense]